MERICRNCGSPNLKQDGNLLKCEYCGLVFHSEREQKIYERMRDLLDAQKQENLSNLRKQLHDYINKNTIDSEAIVDICREIRHLVPDDFMASFYEAAHSGNPRALAEFINKIDVEENYPFIETAIRYVIKELDYSLYLPIVNLMDRAVQARVISLELKSELQRALEEEASNVQHQLFNPNITRDFFIMYSSKDIEKVMSLVDFIESQKFSCFVSQRNVRHGRDSKHEFKAILETAMDNCNCVIFVSSVNSRSHACYALDEEMPYIKAQDKQNAPPEMRNLRYTRIPYKYKKPRIEYLIDAYDGSNVYGEDAVREFFYGLEYVQHDPINVLRRYREIEEGWGNPTDTSKGPAKPKGNDDLQKAKELFEDKKYEEAAELFEKAAKEGDASACCNLGYCYEVGLGVERDLDQAFECYKRAAKAGSARGQYNLGVCYALGIGVDKNLDAAIESMNKAAKSGDRKAKSWLKSNK